MKIFALFLISFPIFAQVSVDKPLAIQFTNSTKSYEIKRKSTIPDKVAVFISSKVNPKYMDLEEVNMDSPNISDGIVVFNRPISTKKRNITSCRSERVGVVSFTNTTITVPTNAFPVRVICYGDSGNYREAYTTFKQ
jgi:hypothetical protein